MAKDLPYFKFFCSEWNDGDITLESYKLQGLFISICSYYWSKECKLHETNLKKRFKNNLNDLDILLDNRFIKIDDNDEVSISFLDEQSIERSKLSNQNSLNAKKRWDKLSGRNAVASDSQCENDAIKRREEKKREDKNKPFKEKVIAFVNWFNEKKKEHTGSIGKFKALSTTDENNLKKLLKDYNFEDFAKAIPNMFSNQWAKETNNQTPAHFLRVDNFNKYLNTEIKKSNHSTFDKNGNPVYKNDWR